MMVDEKTLQMWLEWSRRDDWHNRFVGSDIRQMLGEIDRQKAQVAAERDARQRLDDALRQKDEAMGVLFDRLRKAGVDYSDLSS